MTPSLEEVNALIQKFKRGEITHAQLWEQIEQSTERPKFEEDAYGPYEDDRCCLPCGRSNISYLNVPVDRTSE